jgi:hypothetical protein
MGKEKVPNIQDLFNKRLASLILWSMSLGLVGILTGSLYGLNNIFSTSAYLIAASGTLFCYVMYRIMW